MGGSRQADLDACSQKLLRICRQFSPHAVEHAVQELHGFRAGKLPCDLQSFIDHNGARRGGMAKQLCNGPTQNVSVDRCHSLHTPMFGMAFDQFIDFGGAFGGNAKNVFREALDISTNVSTLSPENTAHVFRRLLTHIGLKQHLQCEFAGFAAGAHAIEV